MENINKALLIAGGVLLAILIVSLLVVFWNQLSAYYTEQHNSAMIEQDAKANAAFENYNGQEIRGNELISVMNKVVNYNTTESAVNGYDRIIMTIDFKDKKLMEKSFKYNESDASIFDSMIANNKISNSSNDNDFLKIANMPSTIISDLSNAGVTGVTDTKLQKLSAEISSIMSDSNSDLEKRNRKLKNILGWSTSKVENISATTLSKIREATKKYYQYTQLKRAMFKCKDIEHKSTSNSRITNITFEIVVENGNIKFN